MVKYTTQKPNGPKIITKDKLYKFLLSCDKCFDESLSSRVNLSEYTNKLFKYAHFILALEKEKIVGMVVQYLNDIENEVSVIPIVIVLTDYRGLGIATELINISILMAIENKFQKLIIDTTSIIAKKTYKMWI